MQALQSQSFLSSDSTAMDQLHDFLHRRRQAPEPLEDFEQIELELHRLFVAAEREALGRELACFDLDVPRVEIHGERYDQVLRCETTYNSAVGPVRVERRLCIATPVADMPCVLWTSTPGLLKGTGHR